MVYFLCNKLRDTKVGDFENTGLAATVKKELLIRFLFQVRLNKIIIKALSFVVTFLFIENAWAAFSLSATPYEGGFGLRFGRVGPDIIEVKKEVTIRVTTDVNKRYRVHQEVIMPLSNAQGQVIPDRDITFYTLPGSNSFGTLAAEQHQYMRSGRILLYTSNNQGQADSFILIYGLRLPEGLAGGTYRGRLLFTLEATDGSQTPQQAYLNVEATLESEASLEVIAPIGGRIELKPQELASQKNEILFKIKGNLGSTYRLIQSLLQPLRSEERELPQGTVLFNVSEGKKGTMAGQDELRSGDTVLYTSNSRGEQDSILVSYHLAEPLTAKAGVYRTRVRYFIETPVALKKQTNLDFLVNIEPSFELKVSPQTGGRIEFRNLKPYQPPQVSEVVVEVATNLGKPYQVSQKVKSLLTNKEGKTISKENFVFYEEKITEGGVLKQSSKTPVEVGETTVFVSDNAGSPTSFKVIYELTVPRDLTAGNYSSHITYSISEL